MVKRIYVNGHRDRRVKLTDTGAIIFPVGFPLADCHHILITQEPWWRIPLRWITGRLRRF
jgi:hypothetical protein